MPGTEIAIPAGLGRNHHMISCCGHHCSCGQSLLWLSLSILFTSSVSVTSFPKAGQARNPTFTKTCAHHAHKSRTKTLIRERCIRDVLNLRSHCALPNTCLCALHRRPPFFSSSGSANRAGWAFSRIPSTPGHVSAIQAIDRGRGIWARTERIVYFSCSRAGAVSGRHQLSGCGWTGSRCLGLGWDIGSSDLADGSGC